MLELFQFHTMSINDYGFLNLWLNFPSTFKVFCTILCFVVHNTFHKLLQPQAFPSASNLENYWAFIAALDPCTKQFNCLKKKTRMRDLFAFSKKSNKNGCIENNNSILLAWMAQRLAKVYDTWQLAHSVQAVVYSNNAGVIAFCSLSSQKNCYTQKSCCSEWKTIWCCLKMSPVEHKLLVFCVSVYLFIISSCRTVVPNPRACVFCMCTAPRFSISALF